ncbi:MAG TPA: hypothetical protein VF556_05565 [Pyrinomonadaceae bacterium]
MNELKTTFSIDEGDAPRKVRSFKDSLEDLNRDINNTDTKPFSKSYSSAFDNLDRRLASTQNNFRKLSDLKFEKNQFDTISQGALAGERRVIGLTNQLKSLRKEANDPANAQFGKYYISAIREIEKELERAERKFSSFNRQQRNLGSSTSGTPQNGFGDAFGSRVFGSALSGGAAGGFAGGVAGAAAVAAVSATAAAVSSLTDEVIDLGIESVKLSANFEQTENNLAVFAGGLSNAREELAAVNKTARDTVGLRLETAEDGYKRLRALGFQAELSRKLVSGLAKEKVVSGSNEQDMQRVIVNFTQLSAGSSRASQDIKEIIHAIPSMRSAFVDAFGTADPKKLKEFIETNPVEFFDKLSSAMNRVKSPAVGLNESIGELKDSGIELGRAFGQPLLDPFTKDVQDLTKYLLENKETVAEWGKYVADTYRSVSDVARGANSVGESGGYKLAGTLGRAGLFAATSGISELIFGGTSLLQSLGEQKRKEEEQKNLPKKFEENLSSGVNSGGVKYTLDPVTNTLQLIKKTVEETPSLADTLDADKAEKDAQKVVASLRELTTTIALADSQQNLDLGKARAALDAKGDAFRLIKETADLETRTLREQITLSNELAAAKTKNLTSEEFNSGKGLIISRENAANIAKLENQILLAQVNSQKQLNEEIEKGKKKVEELGKSYANTFDELFIRAAKDNPIASTFLEGEKALKSLRENLKGLPAEMQNAAIEMQQKLNGNALFEARLDNKLAAFDLRDRAKSLRSVPKEQLKIDDPKKFFDDYIEYFSKKLEQGGGRRFNASFTPDGKGFLGYSQTENSPFTRFHSNIYTDANGNLVTNGFSQSDARNDLLNSYDRVTSADGGFGGFSVRQKTFADLTEADKQTYFAATQKQEINQSANERLQSQLSLLNSGSLNEDQQAIVDKKILGLTSSLDPSQIKGDLREQLALINEREAGRREALERRNIKLQEDKLAVEQQSAEFLKSLVEIAKKDGLSGVTRAFELLITNQSNGAAQVKETQKSADNDSVKSYYEQYEEQ